MSDDIEKDAPFYQQIKLASGEEIICEVDVWDDDVIMVKKALRIASYVLEAMETGDDHYRYSLRPWITYNTDPNQVAYINHQNVVASFYPSELMIAEYKTALDSLMKFNADLLEAYKDFKKYEAEEEAPRQKTRTIKDSDSSNVFQLFSKKDDPIVH